MADKGKSQNGDGVRRLVGKDTEGQQKKTAQHFFKSSRQHKETLVSSPTLLLTQHTSVLTQHAPLDNAWRWTCREINTRRTIQEKGRRAQCKHVSSSHLRVDGKHFGLALVVRRIDVSVVMKRSLVMMIISERTVDVELLVDHLGRQQNIGERKDKKWNGGTVQTGFSQLFKPFEMVFFAYCGVVSCIRVFSNDNGNQNNDQKDFLTTHNFFLTLYIF